MVVERKQRTFSSRCQTLIQHSFFSLLLDLLAPQVQESEASWYEDRNRRDFDRQGDIYEAVGPVFDSGNILY